MVDVAPVIKETKREKKRYPFIKVLPDWFNLNNYQAAYQLDLEGWISQLYLRQVVHAFCKPCIFTGVCTDFSLSVVDSHIKRPSINGITHHEAMLIVETVKKIYDIPREVWTAPSGFDLEYTNQNLVSWFHEQNTKNPTLSTLPLVSQTNHALLDGLISVDLNAPDTLLIAAFKQWLTQQRASTSASQKKKFTKALLRRWATNQILPYIDLLSWSKLQHVQIPHWLMGEALFPGYAQGDKIDRVRKTTEKSAQHAMLRITLYAMGAQFSIETGKSLDLDYSWQNLSLATQFKMDVLQKVNSHQP